MIAKIFWTVVALDVLAALLLWKLVQGGINGLVILLYLFVLGLIAIAICAFPFLPSERWRIAGLIFLILPSTPVIIGAVAVAVTTHRQETRASGTAFFSGPALALAHAVTRQDLAAVQQALPAAGDLNHPHGGGMTLWQFAVMETNETDRSMEILRALLAAGADPKRDTSADSLSHAISKGPRLTAFLLENGANPNILDHEQRPLWWQTILPGDDEPSSELLRLMLDHGANPALRAPDGRGPIGIALARRYWYPACLLIEHGADWTQEPLDGKQFPALLEWEIVRREEYPLQVPDTMRNVLAKLQGKPPAAPRVLAADAIRVTDLLRDDSFENLSQTRASLARLAQQPDWVRRVTAFYEEGDRSRREHAALLLSLKPDALPADAQERCWRVLRDQVAWYDQSAASMPSEKKGWLLKPPAVIALGLATIPGPVRDRHRADFTGLRDRIETCRKANDPAAAQLADLNAVDWMTARH